MRCTVRYNKGMNFFLGRYYVPDGTKPINFKLRAPIEWIPLSIKEDITLLITKNCVDWGFYDANDEGHCIWKDSDLKKMMAELYEDFFDNDEKAIIIEQPMGKIFPLSIQEIKKYLPVEEDRRAVMYNYNECQGNRELFIEHSTYWLRKDSMEDDSKDYTVPYVDAFGNIKHCGTDADEIGIRPAIYVDTKKVRILTAKAGYNSWHHFWKYDEF